MTKRLYRQARRHKALVALGVALLVSLLGLIVYGVRMQVVASRQAELAQRLGRRSPRWSGCCAARASCRSMIWTARKSSCASGWRSCRPSLPATASEPRTCHYALGRGHMALHEYPQALTELQLAIQLGVQGAEVQYALGLVLGKHFEQAMYEARLSGGGDWVRKQLEELEPKYLTPALTSLQRHRSVKLDAPQYLEGLIAYYQRDYDRALQQASAAIFRRPGCTKRTSSPGMSTWSGRLACATAVTTTRPSASFTSGPELPARGDGRAERCRSVRRAG